MMKPSATQALSESYRRKECLADSFLVIRSGSDPQVGVSSESIADILNSAIFGLYAGGAMAAGQPDSTSCSKGFIFDAVDDIEVAILSI